jgi:methionyl-tRNA formyltransferase
MLSPFAAAALRAYLDAGGRVGAVCLPDAAPYSGSTRRPWHLLRLPTRWSSTLPMASPAGLPSVLALAAEREISAFAIADMRDSATLALLESLRAETACVACWPRRIQRSVRARFPQGILNLHPSLLPVHRGPAPLFWTLRHGDATAGVTIHVLDDAVDAGPILAQCSVELLDGVTGFDLETRCASVGGQLLATTVRDVAAGRARPRAQEPDSGSYEPLPQPSDFVVTGDHSARWAYNFIRAAPYWGGPIILECGGASFPISNALSYDLAATLDRPSYLLGAELLVRCQPGVVRVALAETESGSG